METVETLIYCSACACVHEWMFLSICLHACLFVTGVCAHFYKQAHADMRMLVPMCTHTPAHVLTHSLRTRHGCWRQSSWPCWRWRCPCVSWSLPGTKRCPCRRPWRRWDSSLPSKLALGYEGPGISAIKQSFSQKSFSQSIRPSTRKDSSFTLIACLALHNSR